MRFAAIFVLCCALAHAQTNNPLYPRAYTGTLALQAGTPPFNSLTRANSIGYAPAPYNTRLAQVTDSSTICGGTTAAPWFTVPGGGGSSVVATNANETLALIVSAGNETCVLGFNPVTLQVFPVGVPLTVCPGSAVPSRSNPALIYCMANQNRNLPGVGETNGTTLYGMTFARLVGSCQACYDASTFAWSKIVDFATCQKATASAPVWHSTIGLDVLDAHISIAMSWTGGQDTGRYYFVYDPVRQICQTLDTIGDGTHPIAYYSNGTNAVVTDYVTGLPLIASSPVHESIMANNLGVVSEEGDNVLLAWNLNTYQATNVGVPPQRGGHTAFSASYFFNDANPAQERRLITAPSQPTQIAKFGCIEDKHFDANLANDSDPLVGTSGKIVTVMWTTPDCNEVYGLDLSGALLYRFSPTWIGNRGSNFYSQYAIGAVSSSRERFFFTSDMECGLNASCLPEVFVADLSGN